MTDTHNDRFPDYLDEVIAGLSAPEKTLPCKLFYDERGSGLFDRICELDEYYVTRVENALMAEHAVEMADVIGPGCLLIEYGAGSSTKIRALLDHLWEPAAFVPVDISGEHLVRSTDALKRSYPRVEINPVVADFTAPFKVPAPSIKPSRNVVYFPGSTIGNFEHGVALDLLRVMRHEARGNGALLIGVDLQKDAAIIDNAYNDSQGITAEFNLNILRHLNQVYAADFDLDEFSHDAQYDAAEGRVVIHLVSTRDQVLHIGETRIDIAHGEKILTEYSHKYTLQGFAEMAGQADFRVEKVWADAEDLFSVQYLLAI